MNDKHLSVDNAYAVRTPADSARLYDQWANTYDSAFAEVQEYRLPMLVADAFQAAGGKGPVLDIGAGTGLVGERLLEHGIGPIDGVDISSEMLAEAQKKRVYSSLFWGDLTKRLDVPDNHYQGLASAGTFTLGHVGPDAIDEMLRIAAPGALLVLSINVIHYQSAAFEAKFTQLAAKITPPQLPVIAIYGQNADPAHRNDRAYLATFRKL